MFKHNTNLVKPKNGDHAAHKPTIIGPYYAKTKTLNNDFHFFFQKSNI